MGRQVAPKHREGAFTLQWIIARPNHLLPRYVFGSGNGVRHSSTCDGSSVKRKQIRQLFHDPRNASGFVEVFHVVLTRGLKIDKDRYIPARPIELIKVDTESDSARNCSKVNQPVR